MHPESIDMITRPQIRAEDAIKRRFNCVSVEILYLKNLIVFSYFFLDLDTNDFSLFCLIDDLVFDLHRIHRLGKVCFFPADVDGVSHFEFAVSEFNTLANKHTGAYAGFARRHDDENRT